MLLSMLEDLQPVRGIKTDGGFPIDQYFGLMAALDIGKVYTVLPDVVVQISGFESDVTGGWGNNVFTKEPDIFHNKRLMDSTVDLVRHRML